MAKQPDNKINDYVRLDTLDTNVEKFIDKGYVNYIKRTGGQVNQFYSLSDIEDSMAGRYRETEVIFSREIYKRVVLTTKLFPIGIAPDNVTTNFLPHNRTKDDFYFRGRINPSTIERSYATMSFIGGIFKNVRKTTQTIDKVVKSQFQFVGGEFRAPRFDLFTKPEKVQSKAMEFVGGLFKKALIRISTQESIKSTAAVFLDLIFSTRNKTDVFELNFKSKPFPQESNKVDVSTINSNTTTIDGITYLTNGSSLRTLSKSSGLIINYKDVSSSMPFGKVSFGIDFYLREMTAGGYLLDVFNHSNSSLGAIRLNKLDPSQLEIYSGSNTLITPTNTIKRDTWYYLVIEIDNTSGNEIVTIFLNSQKLFEYSGYSFIRDLGANAKGFVLCNNLSRKTGVLANIDRVYTVKNTHVITDNNLINETKEIVAVDIKLDEQLIEDRVPDVTWVSDVPPTWIETNGKIGYQLIGNNLYSNIIPDVTIKPGNNYKIEVEVLAQRLPSVDINKRVILTDSQVAGYELSLVYFDGDSKVRFIYNGVILLSYSTIKANTLYNIKVYKIRQYLVLSINDKFDNLIEYNPKNNINIESAHINPLTIGKTFENTEYSFYGNLYKVKLTNFYKDEGLFDNYYPENVSDIVVLNFEQEYLDEGGLYRNWIESNPNLISLSDKKFGAKSLKLGTGIDTIKIERDPGLSLGTSDFTFEAWVNPTERNQESVIITNGRSTLVDFAGLYPKIVLTNEGKLAYKAGARLNESYFVISNNPVPLNQWSHIALVKEGGSLTTYINGKKESASLFAPPYIDLSYDGTFIGNTNLPNNSNTQFKGYIDSLRLIKGVALYTGDSYDIPILPASADINTSILRLTYESPVDYTLRHDFSLISNHYRNKTFTPVSVVEGYWSGNLKIEDTQNTLTTKSYKVDLSGNYKRYLDEHTARIDATSYITGSYTLKRSFYLNRSTPYANIIAYNAASTDWWMLSVQNGKMALYEAKGTKRISPFSTIDIEFEKWYIVTLVKNGSRFLIFLNGILVIDCTPTLNYPVTGPVDPHAYHGFIGNINDMYFSRNVEYLDTHEIKYPLYFRRSVNTSYEAVNSNTTYRTGLNFALYDDDFTAVETFKLVQSNLVLFDLSVNYTNFSDRIYITGNSSEITVDIYYNNVKVLAQKVVVENTDIKYLGVTRDSISTRIYLDGLLIAETTAKPFNDRTTSIKSNNIYFARDPSTPKSYGILYHSSILKGSKVPLIGSITNSIINKDRENLEAIADDQHNTLPKGRILDNIANNDVFIKSVPESVWRTGAYYYNNTYQKIDKFPKLPNNRFSVEMWVKLEKYGCSLLNNYSLDNNLSYFTLNITEEGYVETILKSAVEEIFSIVTSKKINLNEWVHIRSSYAEGTLYCYLNGTLVKSELYNNEGFYVTGESTFILGNDLNNTDKGVLGVIDYVKINRIPETLDMSLRFDPLEEVIKESKIPAEDLDFVNLNFNYGLTYWKSTNNTITLANNSINSITNTSEVKDSIKYRADISNCIIDKKKLWVYFTQRSDTEIATVGATLRFYSDGLSKGDILVKEIFLDEIVSQQEMYRYFIENLVLGITIIELELILTKDSHVYDINILFEEFDYVKVRIPTESAPQAVIEGTTEKGDYGYSFTN